MSGPVDRESSDRCSRWRKTALRELGRSHGNDYRSFYASLRADGYTREQARGRARTRLGQKYPGTYARLYAAAKRNDR
jgi:hypothetical protein